MMEKCNYRKDPHQDIDHVFRDLLPAHGMVERPAQVELSHQMLDTMLNGISAIWMCVPQRDMPSRFVITTSFWPTPFTKGVGNAPFCRIAAPS